MECVGLTVHSDQLRVPRGAGLGTALGQVELARPDLGRRIAACRFKGQAGAQNDVALRATVTRQLRHEEHVWRERFRLLTQLRD